MKKIVVGFLLLMGAVFAGAQTAVIRDVSGTVEVQAPGTTEWKAAAIGQTLEKSSLISTGFKSTALVAIGNSTITVRPLTRLSLEELAVRQNEEQVTLNLRAGRIRAQVSPPVGGKTDFSVRSPTATASVRGTVFEFDGTRLSVEEGRVHLGGESITGAYIGAGHATAVDTGTGRTATAAEAVQEGLSPALPVGMDSSPSGTAATVPAGIGMDMGTEWE